MSLIDYYIECNKNQYTDAILSDVPEDLNSLMCRLAVCYAKASSSHLNLTEEQIQGLEEEVYRIMNLGNLCRAVRERYLLEGRYKGDNDE
jgi:hypothetical protein